MVWYMVLKLENAHCHWPRIRVLVGCQYKQRTGTPAVHCFYNYFCFRCLVNRLLLLLSYCSSDKLKLTYPELVCFYLGTACVTFRVHPLLPVPDSTRILIQRKERNQSWSCRMVEPTYRFLVFWNITLIERKERESHCQWSQVVTR